MVKMVIGIAIIAWLVIGAVAAFHRGYFGQDVAVTCTTGADTALTILVGPLNWAGLNPKISC